MTDFLHRRRWVVVGLLCATLVALYVLNASRPGVRPEGCFDACAAVAESSRDDGLLRVLDLNMLHGFPRFEHLEARVELIASEIRRLDPDLVCLQEAPWTLRTGNVAASLGRLTGMNYASGRANGNRWAILFEEGPAILSRYPLHDLAVTELLPHATPFEHRVVLRATADTPSGPVQVYSVHLTNGVTEINRGQAASLKRLVETNAGMPAIVCGDFNATEDTPQVRDLAGTWVDAFRAAHPADSTPTCCVDDLTSASGGQLTERIDYIFLAGGDRIWRVHEVRRIFDQPFAWSGGWLRASDHAGLLAELAPVTP